MSKERASKYIGMFVGDDEFFAVSANQLREMIRHQAQWGTQRERAITARRVLARGDHISDGSVFIRLRHFPA